MVRCARSIQKVGEDDEMRRIMRERTRPPPLMRAVDASGLSDQLSRVRRERAWLSSIHVRTTRDEAEAARRGYHDERSFFMSEERIDQPRAAASRPHPVAHEPTAPLPPAVLSPSPKASLQPSPQRKALSTERARQRMMPTGALPPAESSALGHRLSPLATKPALLRVDSLGHVDRGHVATLTRATAYAATPATKHAPRHATSDEGSRLRRRRSPPSPQLPPQLSPQLPPQLSPPVLRAARLANGVASPAKPLAAHSSPADSPPPKRAHFSTRQPMASRPLEQLWNRSPPAARPHFHDACSERPSLTIDARLLA